MWIPESYPDIAQAVHAGDLEESPAFDAKAELPVPKKNKSLAVDVAAMTVDGGVLIYGVAEDDEKRPSVLSPIELTGVADRIDQIVATSIQEVPHIEIREYPDSDDSERGCLVVIVPASPRAPHQVTVGDDMRYYGRGAKGNRILTEGEVERLYERRNTWAIDREDLLNEVIDATPFELEIGDGFLYAYVRPVVTDDRILERVFDQVGGRQEMHQWLVRKTSDTELEGKFRPTLAEAHAFDRHGARFWRLSSVDAKSRLKGDRDPAAVIDLDLGFDGSARLFSGRATVHLGSGEPDVGVIMESIVAGSLESLFKVASGIYQEASYRGPVDVGVALMGIEGATSYAANQKWPSVSKPYPDFAFRNTTRIDVAELESGRNLVESLLRRFFDATTGWDGWSPFDKETDVR